MRTSQLRQAFTLIEALLALAIIGVAFAALALTIVTNLRASVTASVSTATKAAANTVLEDILEDVLVVSGPTTDLTSFAFHNYYWSCPPTGATEPTVEPTHDDVSGSCSGTRQIGDITVDYVVVAGLGIEGEGFITVTVTASEDRRGQTLTIGDRVTCYDIYPAPTVTQPEPCPEPTTVGGGWR